MKTVTEWIDWHIEQVDACSEDDAWNHGDRVGYPDWCADCMRKLIEAVQKDANKGATDDGENQ
jgi:hypothetical protein